jgi:hypothetical protein
MHEYISSVHYQSSPSFPTAFNSLLSALELEEGFGVAFGAALPSVLFTFEAVLGGSAAYILDILLPTEQ